MTQISSKISGGSNVTKMPVKSWQFFPKNRIGILNFFLEQQILEKSESKVGYDLGHPSLDSP